MILKLHGLFCSTANIHMVQDSPFELHQSAVYTFSEVLLHCLHKQFCIQWSQYTWLIDKCVDLKDFHTSWLAKFFQLQDQHHKMWCFQNIYPQQVELTQMIQSLFEFVQSIKLRIVMNLCNQFIENIHQRNVLLNFQLQHRSHSQESC